MTLLSALASLVSIFESIYAILGKWLMVALPVTALGFAACPPQQRRAFAMVAAVTLFSASSLLL